MNKVLEVGLMGTVSFLVTRGNLGLRGTENTPEW
jgi:hypothetical protein